MKNILRITFAVILLSILAVPVFADYNKSGGNKSSGPVVKSTAAGCLPGAGFKYLEVNNVRTRINTGGDMWWDFEVAQYEIPKGSRKTSMFAAALWIGGIDENDQLKLAAHKFRQGPNASSPGTGNDFWPGPLTVDNTAAIDEATCAEYDKHFPISRREVDEFVAWQDNKAAFPNYQIPASILNWPAHGDISKKQSFYLAPFFDADGSLDYNPEDGGDYPYYDLANELCHSASATMETIEGTSKGGLLSDQVIKGDETLWWVFNDKGNIHTETQGTPIGLEIRAQAFGFATNDEINNMTFYSYEIINRSTYRLRDTYFSQWVDTDLGFAEDDYVGCDVNRGLGYSYNGKPKDGDGQFWAYGDQPPAIGVDFFQGPYMDPDGSDNPSFNGEGILGPSFFGDCSIVGLNGSSMGFEYGTESDPQSGNFIVRSEAINGVNFGNGIVDDERFGMRRFVYHNNSTAGAFPFQLDPAYAPQYYNYLKGIWMDNTKMIYGGNGHESAGGFGPAADFMFPGLTDECDWGTNGLPPNGPKDWTEEIAMNQPNDRRFMQSAGPFILEPGAVNYITVGIPWARASSGGPWASVKLLQVVDDKCQLLFDNCFAVVSGPNAPDLTIRELNEGLIFYISNRKTNDAGNNLNESYKELDPAIKAVANSTGYDFDPYYRFEGYQIFQLKDATVSVADIHDQKLARIVYQTDVKNKVTQLVNHNFDQSLNANVPVEEVNGSDLGIRHTFRLTEDAFTGQTLVNHKQYYYLALAYGYNEYMIYSADPGSQEPGIIGMEGQKRVYLAGRKNIKVYTAIPHKNVGTTQANAEYGDGVEITRLQGQGNGGNVLDLTDASIDEILSKKPVDSINQIGSPDYPIAYEATYKQGRGPIDVRVIDPLNVSGGDFILAFDSLVPYYQQVGVDSTLNYKAHWHLTDITSNKTYHSDTTISYKNEQMIPELGIAITIHEPLQNGPIRVGSNGDAGIFEVINDNNGLLESTFTFSDSTKPWLLGVPDIDGLPALNWIRSGVVNDVSNVANSDFEITIPGIGTTFADPNSNYEKIVAGTWAPYILTSNSEQDPHYAPAFRTISKLSSRLSDIASVDIVFTSDKSKWTRCPVVEMSSDKTLSEGGVERFNIRAGASVNVNGEAGVTSTDPMLNSNYINETGMGWFPGYAINLETGERLNMLFGENSWLVGDNGRDMLFNPSSRITTPGGDLVLGGMHYLYVFAHTTGKAIAIANIPAYDAGATLRENIPVTLAGGTQRALVYSSAMYVNMPIANPEHPWLATDAKVRIRMIKPYQRYYSVSHEGMPLLTDNVENGNYPMYSFSTKSIATTDDNITKAQSDLDLINVVPNPYYAYSAYETNQLDNRVKITNLPRRCTVTIYSTNGSMIRQFTKDESGTAIEWDLKNHAGIPIAGGVYLIHVKADGVGEKIVKWFGSLRPIDLNAF